MGTYPRVFVEYRYSIRVRYDYVSVLEYSRFIGNHVSDWIIIVGQPAK